jgi:flagellar biosynthesis/type III secretory pathway M-ring protein FliF/YscJ
MDLLKKQFDRIQQQLAGLSASQKMLTFSLVAIMVMTFLWWGKYAGTSEMEPVVNQSLTADEITNVKRVLSGANISYDVSGDHVLVNAEKKEEALAALAMEQALPRNSSGSLEDIFANMSPFDPPQMTDKKLNAHLQFGMEEIIRQMPGVSDAHVTIDPSHEHLFEGDVEPSASVVVQMRPGSNGDKKMAEAIAEMVAGTNANMRRSRVSLVIGTTVWHIKDRDANVSDGEIDAQQADAEKRNQAKIEQALSYYGAVIAVVTAKVDTVASHISETTYPKIQSKVTSDTDDTSNTTTPQPPSAEPGAAANTGGTLSVGAANPSAAAATSETEKQQTVTQNFADTKVEQSEKPAGEAKVVSATVSVPRSYFINMLKQMSNTAKDPDPAEVDKVFAQKKPELLETIMHSVGLTDEKQVSVDMYFDPPLMLASANGVSPAAAASPITLTLSGHVKEIAIGVLAVLSLFMVSTMVKKSAPVPTVTAAAAQQVETPMLGGNIDIAGEVSEGGQTLDGMELDEDAIKAQQMVEQVSTMVKENPDAAATMVKRWLNRS